VALLQAVGALFLLVVMPGALLTSRILPVFMVRGTAAWVLVLSASLSVAPLGLDWLWRLTNQAAPLLAGWMAMLAALTFLPAANRQPRPSWEGLLPRGAQGWLVGGATLWVAACVVLTYWPERFGGWLLPAYPHDYIKHAAVLSSLARKPLPLGNVFCAELADQPCYYYHSFYLAPATLRVLTDGAVSVGLAFGLFSALTAVATIGLVALLARRAGAGDVGVTLTALSASLMGGLDVLPVVAEGSPLLTLDAWADLPYRIHNFYTNYAWCGQHVSGLVVVLTGCLLLSLCPAGKSWLLLAPALLVSLLGSSLFLALVVWPSALLWCLLIVAKRGRGMNDPFRAAGFSLRGAPRDLKVAAREVSPCAIPRTNADGAHRRHAGVAAVLAVALAAAWAMPLTLGYLDMASRHGGGLTTSWPANTYSLLGRLVRPGVLANLLDLPTTLLLEYGLRFVACFLVGAAVYRRCWADPGLRLLVIASVAGLAGFVTWHSALHAYDYSLKIGLYPSMALTAVFVGLIFAQASGPRRWWNPFGWQLAARQRWWAAPVGAMILLSVPVGLFEAPATAARRLLEVAVGVPEVSAASLDYFENLAVQFVRTRLPEDAVVQTYPGGVRAYLVQLFDRPVGVMDPDHADVQVFQAADQSRALRIFADIMEAGRTDSPAEAYRLLREHRVTHLFIGRVERERFRNVEKFQDQRYFQKLFDASGAAVYEVRPSAFEGQASRLDRGRRGSTFNRSGQTAVRAP